MYSYFVIVYGCSYKIQNKFVCIKHLYVLLASFVLIKCSYQLKIYLYLLLSGPLDLDLWRLWCCSLLNNVHLATYIVDCYIKCKITKGKLEGHKLLCHNCILAPTLWNIYVVMYEFYIKWYNCTNNEVLLMAFWTEIEANQVLKYHIYVMN